MPGRKLSHDEQNIADFWDRPPGNFERPLLRQIRIEADPSLRGISGLVVSLSYPLTVIAGRNGVGKSTVLGVAALSARSPDPWRVYWGNVRPRTQPDARAGYDFGDFFPRRRGAPLLDGLRLTWVSMVRGNEIEITEAFRGGRRALVTDAGRGRRPAKPVREIDFLPMARVLPAAELGAVRAAFATGLAEQTATLNAELIGKLSYIMGKVYQGAGTDYIRGLGLAQCTVGDGAYSAFDMGGGESAVIALLSRIQALPVGGLLIIEEIELGLHAEAQVRLVHTLIHYCRQKRLQVICTTHSETIIDAVPRRARVLLRKHGGENEAISNVSTRFAVHEMTGTVQPELVVYTEDRFAALIVEEAIAGVDRARVLIRDIGSNATVARQIVSHLRLDPLIPALAVFDGDCTRQQVERWIVEERAERELQPNWLILPADGLTPEHWAIRELSGDDYLTAFARDLNCPRGDAHAHVEAMRVQIDHHGCGHTLGQRTGLSEDTATKVIIRSMARIHPGLADLRQRIQGILDGRAQNRP